MQQRGRRRQEQSVESAERAQRLSSITMAVVLIRCTPVVVV